MHKYRRVSPGNDKATESRAHGDAIFFRPNALFAAIALAFFSLSVAHADIISYPDWPLRKDPVNKHNAVFPDSVSNNTVTLTGAISGDVYGGVTAGSDNVENNTVYVRGNDATYVIGGLTKDSDALNNHVEMDGSYKVSEVTGGDAEGTGKAIGNTVTVKNNARIGFSVLGGLSMQSDANDNVLTVENSTIGHMAMGGASRGNGDALRNRAIFRDSTVQSDLYGGYGAGTGKVNNNEVTLVNTVSKANVLGGISLSGVASENHVTITGGEVWSDIAGGVVFNGQGDVSDNTVSITGGLMKGDISGGQGNFTVNRNTVTLSGTTALKSVIGGLSAGGDANGNEVSVTGGSVTGDIYGGFSQNGGSASGNSVTLVNVVKLSDPNAEAMVIGGLSLNGSASNNVVTIDGGKIGASITGGYVAGGNGDATNNTVIIKGNADIRESVIYGGRTDTGTGDVTTGNTLQIWTSGQVTKNVVNFRNFQFIVTPAMMRSRSASTGGDALLTLTEGQTDFTDSNISVAVAAGTRPLDVGDNVVLFRNVDQGVTGLDTATTTEMTGVQGISLEYRIDLNLDPTTGQVGAVVKEAPAVKQTTSVFSTGRMATMGFLNQGSDFALGDGLDRATRIAGTKGAGAYGAVSGKNMRYDTGHGSSASANGAHFLLGVAGKLDGSKDHDVIGSVYAESGWGDIEDHTTTSKGDGKTHYYGLGLIAKYRQNEGTFKGAYGQVNVKAGRANTDFRSNLTSAEGVRGAYDKTASYYGAGAGVGYLVALGKSLSLDLSAAYQWMHLDGYGASVAGDPYRFDAIDSHRTKVGTRLNFTQDKAFAPYVGLAWEHEFSGDATGTTYGLALQKMSMKGDTGVAELGVSFNPASSSRWTVDANVSGAFGQRDGVEGRFMVNVRF